MSTKADYACTDTEVLIVTLLLAWFGDDVIDLPAWAEAVNATTTGFQKGLPWVVPASWRSKGEHHKKITLAFESCLTSVKREAIKFATEAAARYRGAGRTTAPLTEDMIRSYLRPLMMKKEGAVWLGVSPLGKNDAKHGATLRREYLMPQVARLWRDEGENLRRAWAVAADRVLDRAVAETGAPKPPRSAQKVELKRSLESAEETLEDMGEKLRLATNRGNKAVKRAEETRSNVSAALARGKKNIGETAREDAQKNVNAALAVAERRAREAEALAATEKKRADAAERLNAENEKKLKKLTDSRPTELRRLQDELAALRREIKALEYTSEKDDEKAAGLVRELERLTLLREVIWLPRRPRGKGAGKGQPHSAQLRAIYMKLLTLNVHPNAVGEVFATIAEEILGEVRVRART